MIKHKMLLNDFTFTLTNAFATFSYMQHSSIKLYRGQMWQQCMSLGFSGKQIRQRWKMIETKIKGNFKAQAN